MHVCTKLTCKQKNINNYRKVLYTLYIYIYGMQQINMPPNLICSPWTFLVTFCHGPPRLSSCHHAAYNVLYIAATWRPWCIGKSRVYTTYHISIKLDNILQFMTIYQSIGLWLYAFLYIFIKLHIHHAHN